MALGPHIRLIVTKLNDQVAAAGIFVEYGGIVQAHLAGSSEELKSLSPLKVLLDDVRRWAHERGNQVFHLGGGRAGRDGCWHSKRNFLPGGIGSTWADGFSRATRMPRCVSSIESMLKRPAWSGRARTSSPDIAPRLRNRLEHRVRTTGPDATPNVPLPSRHAGGSHQAAECDYQSPKALGRMGAEFRPIGPRRTSLNPLHDFAYLFALLRLMIRERPFAVIAYTTKPVIWGEVRAGFRPLRK
jgi:hypothetical protein